MKFPLLLILGLWMTPACGLLQAEDPAGEVQSVLAKAAPYVKAAEKLPGVADVFRQLRDAKSVRVRAQLTFDILEASGLDVPDEIMLGLAILGR